MHIYIFNFLEETSSIEKINKITRISYAI